MGGPKISCSRRGIPHLLAWGQCRFTPNALLSPVFNNCQYGPRSVDTRTALFWVQVSSYAPSCPLTRVSIMYTHCTAVAPRVGAHQHGDVHLACEHSQLAFTLHSTAKGLLHFLYCCSAWRAFTIHPASAELTALLQVLDIVSPYCRSHRCC